MKPEKRVMNAPTYIQLLLTRKCNLKCFYCGAEQFNEKEKLPELNTGEWVSILKRLREIQVFKLDFSGGEIFLREDIFDILETATKCKFPKISINTNGTLISEKVAKELNSLGLKNIAVSLDGDREVHDRIRGVGSFAETMAGIANLVDNRIVPKILFSPMKMNYKKLSSMAEILNSFGIREISFNRMHPSGRCKKVYKEIFLDCFEESSEFYRIVSNLREKYKGIEFDSVPMMYQNFPKSYKENKSTLNKVQKQKLKPCTAGHSSCNITSSGWVIPCSELPDFIGGNIKEKDIVDIWRNSEIFEKIRYLSNVSVDQINYCKNCSFNVLCNAGCRADAFTVYGDLLAPDPFCPYWEGNNLR